MKPQNPVEATNLCPRKPLTRGMPDIGAVDSRPYLAVENFCGYAFTYASISARAVVGRLDQPASSSLHPVFEQEVER